MYQTVYRFFYISMLCGDAMKSVNETKRTYVLKPWDEVRGKIQNLEIKNKSAILRFFGGTIINLGMTTVEIQKKLMNAIGKKVHILRTDIVNKEYCIKIFEENEEKNHIFGG